ncbi:hypothetical protein [Volucribacter amazonae]|uniref:Uncharacterized protein n=1 Tax=Volucribacter amazonae TaxID=256731 RepID=A0A9X4P7Y9_9PAST|nr:hypothetical protein [Volucribacter amazonae]MDG6894305.1 hypothetical protein [Volucribacter amazonae]
MIDNTFIVSASAILADTNEGLSGNEICKYLSNYAMEYGVDIPYSSYPFPKTLPNKRTALKENLMCFSPEQQYKIIKDLCSLPKFTDNEKAKDIQNKLASRYYQYSNGIDDIPEVAIETKEWLDNYPETKKHYESALAKKSNQIFTRNLLDDLRCAFESLIQQILRNPKSLENQRNELGNFLDNKGISKEIKNFYNDKVIKFFTTYQNNNVKHQDNYKEQEVDYILEQTTVLMRFLIRLYESK